MELSLCLCVCVCVRVSVCLPVCLSVANGPHALAPAYISRYPLSTNTRTYPTPFVADPQPPPVARPTSVGQRVADTTTTALRRKRRRAERAERRRAAVATLGMMPQRAVGQRDAAPAGTPATTTLALTQMATFEACCWVLTLATIEIHREGHFPQQPRVISSGVESLLAMQGAGVRVSDDAHYIFFFPVLFLLAHLPKRCPLDTVWGRGPSTKMPS